MKKELTKEQTDALDEAEDFANQQDKSTEWMIEYARTLAQCTHEQAVDYFCSKWKKEKEG